MLVIVGVGQGLTFQLYSLDMDEGVVYGPSFFGIENCQALLADKYQLLYKMDRKNSIATSTPNVANLYVGIVEKGVDQLQGLMNRDEAR